MFDIDTKVVIAASRADDEIWLAMIIGHIINIFWPGDHQVAHHEIIKHIFQLRLDLLKLDGVEINILAGCNNKFIPTGSSHSTLES